nr:unnamed protein product [Digitaria exilis]
MRPADGGRLPPELSAPGQNKNGRRERDATRPDPNNIIRRVRFRPLLSPAHRTLGAVRISTRGDQHERLERLDGWIPPATRLAFCRAVYYVASAF